MEFPDLNRDENAICALEGMRIFAELRKRYSNDSVRDLDIVLNSLCFALVRLAELNTLPKDAEIFGNIVKQIIVKNLK